MSDHPAIQRTIRIVQVSDTHLSRHRGYFNPNFEVFLRLMQADPPDLIVASGDLSFDGAAEPDDLAFARSQYDRLGVPWRAIPGNHDIGEAARFARLNQVVNSARMANWRRCFGAQWWMHDIGGWRIVALDTSLMASEVPEEVEQAVFVEHALATREGRPVLLFLHMPLYLEAPDDRTDTHYSISHDARHWLMDRCRASGVRAIASAHLHVFRELEWHGIELVWAPTTAFVNIERQLKLGRRFPRAGYVEWRLDGGRISHALIEPPLMITQDVARWNDAVGSTTGMPPWPAAPLDPIKE